MRLDAAGYVYGFTIAVGQVNVEVDDVFGPLLRHAADP